MNGGRKLSQWNIFVKKIFHEGKAKNSNYQFKQALADASKRKSEMGSMKISTKVNTKSRKALRKSKGKRSISGGKSRKHRKR